jgi:hypothetical protein
MDADRILSHLHQRFPSLMAVYAFGSRVQQHGLHAHAQSDLDAARQGLLNDIAQRGTIYGR